MNDPHPLYALQGPSLKFWLGTDNIGRDLLSRLIYGARISMIVGLIASLLSVVISVILGILSAYVGGAFDLIIQRFVDAVLSIPSLLLLMVVISLIGTGMWQVIFCLGISNGIGGSRMIQEPGNRYQIQSVRSSSGLSGCPHLKNNGAAYFTEYHGADYYYFFNDGAFSDIGGSGAEFSRFRHTAAGPKLGRDAERQCKEIYVQRPLDGNMAGSGPGNCGLRREHVW